MPYSEALQESAKIAWHVVNPEAEKFIDQTRLVKALHFMGLDPSRKLIKEFCGQAVHDTVFTVTDIL